MKYLLMFLAMILPLLSVAPRRLLTQDSVSFSKIDEQSPFYAAVQSPTAYNFSRENSDQFVAMNGQNSTMSVMFIICSLNLGPCSAALICSLNLGICSFAVICSGNGGVCSVAVACSVTPGGACSVSLVVCSVNAGTSCSVSTGVCSHTTESCSVAVFACSDSAGACSVSGGSCSDSGGACSISSGSCTFMAQGCSTAAECNQPPTPTAPPVTEPGIAVEKSAKERFFVAMQKQVDLTNFR